MMIAGRHTTDDRKEMADAPNTPGAIRLDESQKRSGNGMEMEMEMEMKMNGSKQINRRACPGTRAWLGVGLIWFGLISWQGRYNYD
jgi:hypothetical protein